MNAVPACRTCRHGDANGLAAPERQSHDLALADFGGRNDKAFGFEGRLDEAAVYNRALSAKEIAEHFAAARK